MSNLLSIGKILNFHGIKGEVKVGYTKNKENQLKAIKEYYIGTPNDLKKIKLSSVRFHKGAALMKFAEINSIEEVMEYKGQSLFVEKEQIAKFLDEDEFYFSDLVGLEVLDINDNYIGKVDYIADIKGENLLAVKDNNGEEFLIPFVKDIVPIVDIKNNLIKINPIDGLMEK